MTRDRFEALVAEGLGAIPERFLRRLENVAIIVDGAPTTEQVRSVGLRTDTLLLGLYEGVSHADGGRYHRSFPDRITLFQQHIEAVARSEMDVRRLVAETVRHEIAHHFGMDEREVRRAERRRTRPRH